MKVATGSMPFSAYSASVRPSAFGASFTSSTMMVTVVVPLAPDGSVAVTITVWLACISKSSRALVVNCPVV